MLRLSKLTDYAMVIVAFLAQHPKQAINAKHIAEKTGISLHTTSKLLKHLSRQQILFAQRGIKGGYQLTHPASDISLKKIIQALEGQIALTECSHSSRRCLVEKHCMIRDTWRRISASIQETLCQISVADLIQPTRLESKLRQTIVIAREAQ